MAENVKWCAPRPAGRVPSFASLLRH